MAIYEINRDGNLRSDFYGYIFHLLVVTQNMCMFLVYAINSRYVVKSNVL